MANETPTFWWKKRGLASFLLSPAAGIYGYFAERAMERAKPPQIDAPVLCIGNFTLGGTGKTPLAIAFAKAARKQRLKPGIVSRGFGGTISGRKNHIHLVDPAQDRAREVGDEPLLLAGYAPVAIGVNRLAAAEKLLREGVNFIIMDDGFQSRRLYPDYALLAVDAMRGLGNGKIFPAGPLRAPLPVQLAYSDALVLMGESPAGNKAGEAAMRLAARAGKPACQALFRTIIAHAYEGASAGRKNDIAGRAAAHENSAAADNEEAGKAEIPAAGKNAPDDNTGPAISTMRAVKGRHFLAFAGIGNPQKFFAGVEAAGGIIAQKRGFADHHFFSKYDIEDIAQSAHAHNLVIVTTAKDYMRLKTDGLDKKLGPLLVLDIRLEFLKENFCGHILDLCIDAYKDRRFS